MRLTAPTFWYGKRSLLSDVLLPLSWLYGLGHAWHQQRGRPYRASVPVLCLGNLVAGGSGKTPAALALAILIKKYELATAPGFLSRGYGGRLRGPVAVDPAVHTAGDVGDEPLLLARTAQTVIAADRAEGARLLERMGADLIIMDDGLHNRTLEKTVKLVVVDGASGFGNTRLLPAGPLRTPLARGLTESDAVILVGDDGRGLAAACSAKPVFAARIETQWRADAATTYFAFCGLAHPRKFFHTLKEQGAAVAATQSFPDHHLYSVNDLEQLETNASRLNARLITTAKDAVRLPKDFKHRNKVDILPIELQWRNETDVVNFVKARLPAKP
jgi:tetraacyldisaccharide 4'-kinase